MEHESAYGKAAGAGGGNTLQSAAALLHSSCAVYTQPSVARRILDAVGWTEDVDLSEMTLLEPAAGDGVFVKEAAARLVNSVLKREKPLTTEVLQPRISAFELIAGEASKARRGVLQLLARSGVPHPEASRIARAWVKTADFLLLSPKPTLFTHVVGNPPYMRWSKIPMELRERYEVSLPPSAARGDLFLPFMDSGISALLPGGWLGFLCSNRWRHMAFASAFRRERLPSVDVLVDMELSPQSAFERNVGTYPSIVVMQRRANRRPRKSARDGRTTLADAGFKIKVGPALGCTDAFVLPNGAAGEIEEELLAPWLSPSDVLDGRVQPSTRRIICLHDDQGQPRDLASFPKARNWLERFRSCLQERAIVRRHGAPWHRTIDKVVAATWAEPKLLVPELARVPRVALDRSGAVPAHGLYAIMKAQPEADIQWLSDHLSNGRFARLIEPIAPKVNGGHVRCYKRFLERITLL